MGGNRARHGVQMDNRGRPATHAIATGVPTPSASGSPLAPPPRPHTGRVEGHAEPSREWMATPGTQYPPGPVLEQLTAPTPGVRHVLHRASAPTEQLNDEVLDLALEPLRVLYPQAHIPPVDTSNRLARLGLQRHVEAAHTGGVLGQWQTLHNPSTAQGHWDLHPAERLLPDFLPCVVKEDPVVVEGCDEVISRRAGAPWGGGGRHIRVVPGEVGHKRAPLAPVRDAPGGGGPVGCRPRPPPTLPSALRSSPAPSVARLQGSWGA